MRTVSQHAVTVTTDAAGAGTVTTTVPVSGYLVEVRVPNAGTAVFGSTADYTLTNPASGGTVYARTNVQAPFTHYPARAVQDANGGTAVRAGCPVDGYVTVVVAQGGSVATTSMYLTVADNV